MSKIENSKADKTLRRVIQHFKLLRTQRGISHAALAAKTGITRPAISHIESGKRRPSLLTALKMANALDEKLSDIVRIAEKHGKRR